MKSKLTMAEKLKDLRTELGMSQTELATAVQISKGTISNYENDDNKSITLEYVQKLADFFKVPVEYLLGLTDNREEALTSVSELGLDDDAVRVLKDKQVNCRLLGEIIKHPDFKKFIFDTEVYVDSLASMQINNLNDLVTAIRTDLAIRNTDVDEDLYYKTLGACKVDENDYFDRLVSEDIIKIVNDIKNDHKNDSETGDDFSPLNEVVENAKKYTYSADPMKNTLTLFGKQFGINLSKMSPAEIQTLTTLIKKHSTYYKRLMGAKEKSKQKSKQKKN